MPVVHSPSLLIHATNIQQFSGASIIATRILEALRQDPYFSHKYLYLPTHHPFVQDTLAIDFCIYHYRRIAPQSISRFFELCWSQKKFHLAQRTLVLGDIPLKGIPHQIVYLHNAHLIDPHINKQSSRRTRYRIARRLLARNLQYVEKLCVPSPIMAQEVARSYPQSAHKITIHPPPPPVYQPFTRIARKKNAPLRLFYPATNAPHKNHQILIPLAAIGAHALAKYFCFDLTLSPIQLSVPLRQHKWIHPLGRLTHEQCLTHYSAVDVLFFPSLLESYGVPLVEAMVRGRHILCADLPYARWLTGDRAHYFNPLSAVDLWQKMQEILQQVAHNPIVDWRPVLKQLPNDWTRFTTQMQLS